MVEESTWMARQELVVPSRSQAMEPEAVVQDEAVVQAAGGRTWGSSLCSLDSGATREEAAWEALRALVLVG
jgi:hypothetical protein